MLMSDKQMAMYGSLIHLAIASLVCALSWESAQTHQPIELS